MPSISPDLGDDEAETYIVRQLAGYSRDIIIREALGVGDDEIVRCVLIYPERVGRDEFRKCNRNPFKQAFELIMKPSAAYNHFYTITRAGATTCLEIYGNMQENNKLA